MRKQSLFVIALVLFVAAAVPSTAAQEMTTATEETTEMQLALGRMCSSEEGLARPTDGCAAIYAVIAERARINDRTWLQQARLYSRQSFNRARRDARRYIAHLRPDGAQPEGWPTIAWRRVRDEAGVEQLTQVRHAPWSMPEESDDYQRRWLRIYERAGQIVRAEEQHRCSLDGTRVTPVHWGCPDRGEEHRNQCDDYETAETAGWVRLSCGATARNWFYCDPDVSDRCRVDDPDVTVEEAQAQGG